MKSGRLSAKIITNGQFGYQRSSDTFNKEKAAEGPRHCEMSCTPVDSSSAGRVAWRGDRRGEAVSGVTAGTDTNVSHYLVNYF